MSKHLVLLSFPIIAITPVKKKKLTISTAFYHYCHRWLSHQSTILLLEGLSDICRLECWTGFDAIHIWKSNHEKSVCQMVYWNYKSSSILHLWELAKTFLFNLLKHFVPAISANIYLLAVLSRYSWMVVGDHYEVWLYVLFFFSFQMLQSNQALRYVLRTCGFESFSLFLSFVRLVVQIVYKQVSGSVLH